MSTTPTTPPKATNVLQNSSIQATPYNQGSSSHAEHRSGVTVQEVKPEILHDIKSAHNPDIHNVILGLIRFATRCTAQEAPDILDGCLEAVTSMCNNDTDYISSKFTGKIRSEKLGAAKELRSSLEEYCPKPGHETHRYPPFVRSLNSILRAFRGSNTAVGLPTELPEWDPSLDPLFHTNDPRILTGSYDNGNYESSRKPDIVLLFLQTVALAHKSGHSQDLWSECVKEATISSKDHFQGDDWWRWENILQPWELKVKGAIKLIRKQLKSKYDAELLPGKALHVPESGLDEDSAGASVTARDSSGQPESKGSTKRSDALPTRQSERLRSGASGSSPASGSGDRSGGSDSLKRKASSTGASQGSSKKYKEGFSPHVSVQSALYGAERLCSHISIAHATGMIIVDDLAYFCWYDRQGCIRSTSLNFIENLPYFAVLVVLFGRFSKSHWGINIVLEDKNSFSIEDVSLRSTETIYNRFSLVGRGTMTMGVELATPEPPPDLATEKLIVKLSFPEELRTNEKDIIEIALKKAKGKERENEILDHIPHAFRSEDFADHATSRIREQFGLPTKGSRTMRILLFRRYNPIVKLPANDFWRAYWEIVQCHFRLWLLKVAHGDISVNNLMYDEHDGKIRGILNDFDLATILTDEGTPNHDRTGTMPFMALDLLTEDGMKGMIRRLYRHDLESFAWVLLWIVASYNEAGAEIDPLPFMRWLDPNIDVCQAFKMNYLPRTPAKSNIAPRLKRFRRPALRIMRIWVRRFRQRQEAEAESDSLAESSGSDDSNLDTSDSDSEVLQLSEIDEQSTLKKVLDAVAKTKAKIPKGLETLKQAKKGMAAEKLARLARELTIAPGSN